MHYLQWKVFIIYKKRESTKEGYKNKKIVKKIMFEKEKKNFMNKEIIQKKSASRDPHIVYIVSYVFYCIVPTVVNYHAM